VLAADGTAMPADWPADRVFTLRRRVVGFSLLDGTDRHPPHRVYLLSGIARPARFAEDAVAHGLEIVRHRAFPDHHRFRARELRAVAADAKALGAEAILTTAKDAVRLPDGEWTDDMMVLRIAAEVTDEARFREWLQSAVRSRA
jgi:tetraacyldisaccharide 4'-kinase